MPNFEDETISADSQSARIFETFAVGQILATKYKVISLLGSGGMGSVYRVQQIFLDIELALKVLDGKQHLNESQMRRFTIEAKAAYSLNHHALVKVHDFGLLENGQPYLVMDLVAGKTLADHLKEFGPMPLKPACEVFVQAAEGLYYAHQQSVIHRDIKPSNIMILEGAPPGSPGSVKIVDFGIAKIVGEDMGEVQALTRTGEIFGSPFYMSPEQCSGELVDHRTDIYSLGCAFFETLTGTPPYVGVNALRTMMLHKTESPPKLRDASMGVDFPESLELVIQQMLAKSPHERYENLKVVAREIDEAARGDGKTQTSNKKQKNKSKQSFAAKNSATQKNAEAKSKPAPLLISLVLLILVTASATIIFHNSDIARLQKESAKSETPESEQSRKAKIRAESMILQTQDRMNDSTYKNGEESRKGFSRAVPIKVIMITENVIKKRQINFPPFAVGEVECDYNNLNKREARGDVRFPAEGHLQLIMGGNNSTAFETPAVINKIAPNIFYGLAIEAPNAVLDTESSNADRESRFTKHMTEIIASASKWTKLRAIIINSLVIDKSTVQEIAKIKHLDRLQILNVRGSEIELLDQPFMRKLTYLRLNQVAVTDLLKTISGSPALKSLFIEKVDLADSASSEAAFKDISRCPNLDSLTIGKNKITDNGINDLIRMKSLHSLTLVNVPIVSRQVQNLLKSPTLRELWLVGTTKQCLLANPVEDPRLKFAEISKTTVFDQLQ
jgi:serine/threonine protein kinase